MAEELAVFVFVAIILAMLALTFVVWLRQDMHQMEDRLNERFERLEGRLAAAERGRVKSESLREAVAVRAAAE